MYLKDPGPAECGAAEQLRADINKLGAGNCPGEQAGAPWSASLQMKTRGSHFNLEGGRHGKEQEEGGDPSTLGCADGFGF